MSTVQTSAAPAVFDLAGLPSKATAEAGFDVRITDPKTGEKTGIRIRVLGADSEAYQRKTREVRKRLLEQLARQGRHELSAEEELEIDLDTLAEVTVGWTVTLKGVPLEFTPQNVRMVYAEWPCVREEVRMAIHNRANFSPSSAST